MPYCELLDTCIFFNDQMANMPAVADLMKKRYCRSDYSSCARMMIVSVLGREQVPPDLFPNQREHAQNIISRR